MKRAEHQEGGHERGHALERGCDHFAVDLTAGEIH